MKRLLGTLMIGVGLFVQVGCYVLQSPTDAMYALLSAAEGYGLDSADAALAPACDSCACATGCCAETWDVECECWVEEDYWLEEDCWYEGGEWYCPEWYDAGWYYDDLGDQGWYYYGDDWHGDEYWYYEDEWYEDAWCGDDPCDEEWNDDGGREDDEWYDEGWDDWP